MHTYLIKDITTVERGIVAHGVNCQGAMASGVAAAIRGKWPKVYSSYVHAFKTSRSRLDLLSTCQFVDIDSSLWVVNIFTQEYYGRDGKRYADVDAIETGLTSVCEFAVEKDLPVFIPQIGCALGGLSWDDDVEPIVYELSRKYNVDVTVCIFP